MALLPPNLFPNSVHLYGFSRVKSLMGHKLPFLNKSLPAICAFVWLLAGVDSLMVGNGALATEGLSALRAFIRFLPCDSIGH